MLYQAFFKNLSGNANLGFLHLQAFRFTNARGTLMILGSHKLPFIVPTWDSGCCVVFSAGGITLLGLGTSCPWLGIVLVS